MRVFLANESKNSIGGGWTFLRTFEKYLRRMDQEVVPNADLADIVFISGATMVKRESVKEWKDKGKKIVLRIDNIPRNSRNRNTGTSRLYDFAQMADLVVYQSQWAKDYIMPFVRRDGVVILNGADTDIFKPDGEAVPKDGKPQYLFCQFNRDETKRWHEAWYEYIMRQRQDPEAHLWIVGRFSPETIEYKFDFFQNERFSYRGIMETPEEMAEIFRGTDVLLLPYFNDACSNTLIEFKNCNPKGKIILNPTGGNSQIMSAEAHELTASFMTAQYIEEMRKI